MNEQWERPDRDAVIRDNPLLEYYQARGWRLKHDGAANRYKCLCPLPQHREKTPSFTIFADQDRFHCFGCGVDGGVFELHMELKGVSGMEAMCELAGVEYHGGKGAGSATEQKNNPAPSQSGNTEPHNPFKDPEKAQRREGWPVFEVPTQAEIETIATLRGLSPEGVALAVERGLLFCADYCERRAWIITDSQRVNAQARRLDGQDWIIDGEAKKARTLPGSVGAWPIGLREALDFPNIALVEGGPDLGTSLIPQGELRHFKGKHVRIFADDDEAGLKTEGRWWRQLESAGAMVDGYSFAGFIRSDGKPVKDLNDFALIDPDQWEAKRDAIEEAFRFSD